MNTFKQYLEYQMWSQPPNQYDAGYAQKLNKWEIDALNKTLNHIKTTDQLVAAGKPSPIVRSPDNRYWTPMIVMPSGGTTNTTNWNPQILDMLKKKGIVSQTTNTIPITDPRNNKPYPANNLAEIHTDLLISALQNQASASQTRTIGTKIKSAATSFGNKALEKAGQGSVPAFQGTTIMGGYH